MNIGAQEHDRDRSGGKRPYRMGTRREAVERTREQILRATYGLWLQLPYDEVTMEAVADAAGVSRQTVHRQFGSKDELIVAVAAWRGPQEDAAREVEPGDVGAAVRRLIDRNEEMGDANVRALELEGRVDAIDHMLARGRAAHRAWIEHTFDPYLPTRRGASRDRAVDALYAATDVTVWKLLRRDLGRSRSATDAVIRRMVEGVLATLDDPNREGGR